MTLLIVILIAGALYFLLKDKRFFSEGNTTNQKVGVETIDDKFNASKKAREQELDALLDKISKKGLNHLSEKEKKRLEELSK